MVIRYWIAAMLVVSGAAISCAPQAPEKPGLPAAENQRLVDLAHEYSADAIFWPTAETFRLDVVADGMTPQGYYYASNNF